MPYAHWPRKLSASTPSGSGQNNELSSLARLQDAIDGYLRPCFATYTIAFAIICVAATVGYAPMLSWLYRTWALNLDAPVGDYSLIYEPYRLISYSLTHINPEHMIHNLIVLVLAGWIVEPIVGSFKTAILYFSGVIGAALSIMVARPAGSIGLVGSSGGCYALVIMLLIILAVPRLRGMMPQFKIVLAFVLAVTYLWDLQRQFSDTPESYAQGWAHVGGIAGGLLVGLWYLACSTALWQSISKHVSDLSYIESARVFWNMVAATGAAVFLGVSLLGTWLLYTVWFL